MVAGNGLTCTNNTARSEQWVSRRSREPDIVQVGTEFVGSMINDGEQSTVATSHIYKCEPMIERNAA